MSRLAALAALVVLSGPAHADPLPEKEAAAARAVVEGSFRDAANKDWAAYARRIDPAGLKAFRDDWAALLTSAAKDGRDAQLLPLLAGTRSTTAALAYTPEEFFARFLKGSTGNAPAFTATKSEVLGVVAEGPDRAHAVVRVTHGPSHATAVEVVSLRKVGGVWRAEVPRALAAVAVGFRSADVGVGTAKATDRVQPESPNP